MKKYTLVASIALTLLLGAGTLAFAGIALSNHDMPEHDNLLATSRRQGPCSFCHVPHGASGEKLFNAGTGVTDGSSYWVDDGIASICFSCHGGIQTFNSATNVNPFQGVPDSAHGRDVTLLATAEWGDIAAEANLNSIYGTSQVTGIGLAIGCQSCHDPHDNTFRPFLRDNTGNLVAGDFLTLCDDCHINRADPATMDVGAGTRINHPANNRILADNTSFANLYAYGVVGYDNRFNSTWADLSDVMTENGGPAQHWNLGGKFKNDGTGGPGGVIGEINCGTCHMVHSNELDYVQATYVGDGLADNVTVTAGNNIDWTWEDLLVMDKTPDSTGIVAPICAGCHDITVNAGPGWTGTFSHPWDRNGWNQTIDVVTPVSNGGIFGPTGGSPVTQTIICQSCHDMHNANNPDTVTEDYALMANVCSDCHATGKTDHHPYDVTVTYGTDLRGGGANAAPVIGASVDWDLINAAAVSNNSLAAWTASTGSPNYFFENDTGGGTGLMTCGTCHGSGAHNNSYASLLTGDNTDNTMCVDCHGINPSAYTGLDGTDRAGLGSHIVGALGAGDVATPGYLWGGSSTASQDAVDPESGVATAKYGADGAVGDVQVICESCHYLLTDSNNGPFRSDNGPANDDNESSTADSIGLLLSSSGNNLADAAAANDFLCSACHGGTPGAAGTSSHPINTTMSLAVGQKAGGPNDGVTHVGTNDGVSTGEINCESCHRPHNASSPASTKILEHSDNTLGYVNQEVLCNSCHSK